jgi:hypothetical protein
MELALDTSQLQKSLAHVVRLITAILTPQVSVIGVSVRVAVLQPAQSLIQCASAKVESKVRFSINNLAPLQELISAKLVAFLTKPGKFWSGGISVSADDLNHYEQDSPHRSLVFGTNTIEPVVGSHKVTARISNNGTIEVLEGFNHVLTETIVIR